MKLGKRGIWFNYNGDELLWLWWWNRHKLPNGKKAKYESLLCESSFEDLQEYWMFWGEYAQACRQDKVYGYSEDEVFQSWAQLSWIRNIVVILRHINYELKPGYFWASIGHRQRAQLKKDVAVLFFNRPEDAEKVFNSIQPEFAEAYYYKYGKLMATNNEVDTKSEQKIHPRIWAG